MDVDDISFPNRFQHQIERFLRNIPLSVVGGQISEFSGDVSNIIGIQETPKSYTQIVDFAKKHCPMNQISLMFQKMQLSL